MDNNFQKNLKSIIDNSKYLNLKSLELFGKDSRFLNQEETILLDQYIYDCKNPKWLPVIINNKETKYIISNTGIIKNIITNEILIEKYNHKGYKYVNLNNINSYENQLVHRLVAEAFIPNPDNKPQVNHISGIKTCNWVGNLEWNTCQENIQHAVKMGLFYRGLGEKANASIYTDAQIHQVCKYLEKGLLNTEISKLTGVDVYVISKVKCKNCWTHISDKYNIPRPIQNAKGSAAAASKYNDKQIHQVCQMLKDKQPMTIISKATDVGYDMIYRIKTGKNWQDISSQYGIIPYQKN